MFHSKSKVVKNTLILLFASLMIRFLGLGNRILLTRLLGQEGISLYMISMPTIMLFISIGSLSLSIAMTKVAARKPFLSTIKKGMVCAIFASTISSFILWIILKHLTYQWLKQPTSYYPILLSIPLIYLTSISSVLRGYYNGIQKMGITSCANLIEQITRILFTVMVFAIEKEKNILYLVSLAMIAMSIGELCSILFTSFQIKKYIQKGKEDATYSNLLSIAIPTTCSSLISNVTFFFEPILYTLSLTLLHVNKDEILFSYSEVTAYALPLITMFSFIPMSIATSILPNVARTSNEGIAHYIQKSLFYSFLPAILITVLLTVFSKEWMNLLYGTTIGSSIVSKYASLFIVFYAFSPCSAVMQATNQSKKLFLISSIIHIMKLVLLFVLPWITKEGFILSYLITDYLFTFTLLFILFKKYHFKISFSLLLRFVFLYFCLLAISLFLKSLEIHYFIVTFVLILLFVLLYFILFFHIRNEI